MKAFPAEHPELAAITNSKNTRSVALYAPENRLYWPVTPTMLPDRHLIQRKNIVPNNGEIQACDQ